ncbi:MAG: DUF1028 domain-containing protein [Ignavibacteria bacterium]|nr:DUF1028 domain-containing protein [Ignavibacteria bacterium]
MKKLILFILVFTLNIPLHSQFYNFNQPFAHTYSIVARDEETGELGVAVQSHWFSVGSIVSWAEAGVGAIATQSFVNVSFGPEGLRLLKEGKNAVEVLDELISKDEGRDFRQLAIIDANGNVATYTGTKCIEFAHHQIGKNYSVQANMMLNDKVVPAMAEAFEKSKGPLAERLLEALKAAQKAGGDIRGQQSASLLVVRGKSTGKIWEDRLIDLRVEDHPQPVKELERLLKLYRAYEHMNKGDLAIEKGDEESALREYGAACNMFPENLEMKYWYAVSLVNINKFEEAKPLFMFVFKRDKNWIELTKRIVKNGLLKVDEKRLNEILKLGDTRKN